MFRFLLLFVAILAGCAYGKPRYESTSAWIDPERGLVLLEVAHPKVFVGCDTNHGSRDCREQRGYKNYRTVVVDIKEGRIVGEAITSGPTAPILEGYPTTAPRVFSGRVNVVEYIAGDPISYLPYAPTSSGWLYVEPGRKRVAVVDQQARFFAADFDELMGMGIDETTLRIVDRSSGHVRVASTHIENPTALTFTPLDEHLPDAGVSLSPNARHLSFPTPDGRQVRVLDLGDMSSGSKTFDFDYPVDAAFISNDTLIVVQRKASEPEVHLVELSGQRTPLVSEALGLRNRVLMPGTPIVAFVQTRGVVFVSPDGGFAEFPPPIGPVSIHDSRIHLMYDDHDAGDRVLVEFNMETGEEFELQRFEPVATLLGKYQGTLVVYAPNPLLPGTLLYLVNEATTHIPISTQVEGENLTVFGPINTVAP